MAAKKDSTSLTHSQLNAGDMFYELCCTSCTRKGLNNEASKYCANCKQYFCVKCVVSHDSLLTGHVLVDAMEKSLKGSGLKFTAVPTELCKIHHLEVINMYCGNCDVVECSVCFTVNHKSCHDIHYIPEFVQSNFPTKQIKQINTDLSKAIKSMKKLKTQHDRLDDNLEKSKAKCKQEIQKYRDDINRIVDSIEAATLAELEIRYKNDKKATEDTRKNIQDTHDELIRFKAEIESDQSNDSQKVVIAKLGQYAIKQSHALHSKLLSYQSSELKFTRNPDIMTFLLKVHTLGLLSHPLKQDSTLPIPFTSSKTPQQATYTPTTSSQPWHTSYSPTTSSQPRLTSYVPTTISQPRLTSYLPTASSQPRLTSYLPTTRRQPRLTSYLPTTRSQPRLASYLPTTSSQPRLTSYLPTARSQPRQTSYSPTTSSQSRLTSYSPTTRSQPRQTSYLPTTSSQSRQTSYSPTTSSQSRLTSYSPTTSSQLRLTSYSPTTSSQQPLQSPFSSNISSKQPTCSSAFGDSRSKTDVLTQEQDTKTIVKHFKTNLKGESKRCLYVCAIEIGNPYSAWAFSFFHEFKSSPTRHTFKRCDTRNMPSKKTPTCVIIDKTTEQLRAYGSKAEDMYRNMKEDNTHTDCYYFRGFMMMLIEKLGKKLDHNVYLEDETGKSLPAVLVLSLTIKYLVDDMLETLDSRRCQLAMTECHCVVIVPAICTDAAKQFMRVAAIEAGIDDKRLTIALEQEAVYMHCRQLPADGTMDGSNPLLKADNNFIVIDAGGETVVTLYENLGTGQEKEVQSTSIFFNDGDILVDKAFEDLISDIFTPDVIAAFKRNDTEDWSDLLREFEKMKRQVTPKDTCRILVRIPSSLIDIYSRETETKIQDTIANSRYAGQIVFNGYKLRFEPNLFLGLFDEYIRKTVGHVRSILRNVQVKAIFIIGDSLNILIHAVKNEFARNNICVVTPHWSSTYTFGLAGALIYGHSQ